MAVREGVTHVDVVGFSMGALVARWFIQRGGGKEHVRRFVSISGPHAGTSIAYAGTSPGAKDMRPDSALLKELAADVDPFGNVEVHCVYTPYDLLILPARSSILVGAQSVKKFSVPTHRRMISDDEVLDYVARLLNAPKKESEPIRATGGS